MRVAALIFCALLFALGLRQGPLDPADPYEFVLRVDELQDVSGIGGKCRPGCTLKLEAWQREILPWFAEEGIVNVTNEPKPVWAFHDDEKHNHVLGQSDCEDGLWVNARYINPVSSWYQDVRFLSTFTHELVHSQQGIACDLQDREVVEATAVVVSLEVMAALANNGNRWMAYALLDELQGIVLGELRYRSLGSESARTRLNHLLGEIDGDPWERAERAQRYRYWDSDVQTLRFVLRAYAHRPYVMLLKALDTGSLGGLALAPVYTSWDPTRPDEIYRVPVVDFSELRAFLRDAEELLAD